MLNCKDEPKSFPLIHSQPGVDPEGVRLHLNNFILIPCGVTELLRKISKGAEVR